MMYALNTDYRWIIARHYGYLRQSVFSGGMKLWQV